VPLSEMPLLNPSALEAFKASPGLLDGVFPSGAVPDTLPVDLKLAFGPSVVALGNTLPVSAVASFPSTVAFVADPTERFTLVLADPDAPSASSPTSRSFLHVIKPNLRALGPDRLVELAQAGEDAADGGEPSIVEVPKEELMPWRAPGPGKGSGAHRYGRSRPTPSLCTPSAADTTIVHIPPLHVKSGCSSRSRTASSTSRATTRCATASPRVVGASTSRRLPATSSAAARSSAQTSLSSRRSLETAGRSRVEVAVDGRFFLQPRARRSRGRVTHVKAHQGLCQPLPLTRTTHAPSSHALAIAVADASSTGGWPSGGM
jgi:hypothetical protein